MRLASSSVFTNWTFTKDEEDQFNISPDLYSSIISNADGVSYQFLFGSSENEGYFLNLNSSLKELFEIDYESFSVNELKDIITEFIPLDKNIPTDYLAALAKVFNGEVQNYKAEIIVSLPDGKIKYIRDSALPLRDDKTGKIIGMAGIFFEVTEYRNIIQQLECANNKVSESDRLKTAFLNNLSHEIRTPLNAIVGFSTLLGETDRTEEENSEYLNIIIKSSDHLLEVMDDLIEMSKIETSSIQVNKTEININNLIQRVHNNYLPEAQGKDINLSFLAFNYKQDILFLTDGYKLSKAISNLISNAIKFTNAGGKVEFGYNVKDDEIEFFVTDTGIGIGPEHQPNIFQPFYQAECRMNKRYEGIGLGLTIARSYIELLGGYLWFSTIPGAGSDFRFSFPFKRKLLI